MGKLNPWRLQNCSTGQKVVCTVIGRSTKNQYRVIIMKNGLCAELRSDVSYSVGDDVLAKIIVVTEDEVVLSARLE